MPTRFLHDCRRTAARNLIRASVAERVAMLLTGHKSRAIFDRDNIIHEGELLNAGDQLVASLARQAPAPRRRAHLTDKPCIGVNDARPDCRGGESHAARFAHRAAPPPRATHHRVRAHDEGRRARRWTRGTTPGGRDPLNAKPTAGPRRAIPPHKAAHTATGGARGRNRSRSPLMAG